MQINADNDGPTTGAVQEPAESAPRDAPKVWPDDYPKIGCVQHDCEACKAREQFGPEIAPGWRLRVRVSPSKVWLILNGGHQGSVEFAVDTDGYRAEALRNLAKALAPPADLPAQGE